MNSTKSACIRINNRAKAVRSMSASISACIRENGENVHRLASCLTRMATNFESGFNEIVPLLDTK